MSAMLCGRSVTEGNDLVGRFGPFESPGKTVTSPNMPVHTPSAPDSHPFPSVSITCVELANIGLLMTRDALALALLPESCQAQRRCRSSGVIGDAIGGCGGSAGLPSALASALAAAEAPNGASDRGGRRDCQLPGGQHIEVAAPQTLNPHAFPARHATSSTTSRPCSGLKLFLQRGSPATRTHSWSLGRSPHDAPHGSLRPSDIKGFLPQDWQALGAGGARRTSSTESAKPRALSP